MNLRKLVTLPCSLVEYSHFHSMLSSPSLARRCMSAFTGHILILPVDYDTYLGTMSSEDNKIAAVKYFDGVKSMHDLKSYYSMSWASMTGLSTFLGLTELEEAVEVPNSENLLNSTFEEVSDRIAAVLPDKFNSSGIVYNYMAQIADADLKLVRYFRYHYKLAQIKVTVLHLTSLPKNTSSEVLSVVMIYDSAPPLGYLYQATERFGFLCNQIVASFLN